MNTMGILNLVTSLAFEHAMDNTHHPYLDGYEIFPEKRFEIYLADPSQEIGTAVFECRMHNRTGIGFMNGTPRTWDKFCIAIEQFKLKKMEQGRTHMAMPLLSEEWWEVFYVILEEAKKQIPEAVYDEKTGLWWMGDKGFDPIAKKEV